MLVSASICLINGCPAFLCRLFSKKGFFCPHLSPTGRLRSAGQDCALPMRRASACLSATNSGTCDSTSCRHVTGFMPTLIYILGGCAKS